MCNRYSPPSEREIIQTWRISNRAPARGWKDVLVPRGQGPFIRGAGPDAGDCRELVVGQWGLIPWFSKSATLTYSTNNARSEEMHAKASYRQPWARAQRCIIPAADFDEPCWETGRNVWWRFRRADGAPWGLAGLWNAWTDPDSGQVHESYTMLTLNADAHPVMRRMHKPDPKLAPDQQDKRSVIAIEADDVDAWLSGTLGQAQQLLRVPAAELLDAAPA